MKRVASFAQLGFLAALFIVFLCHSMPDTGGDADTYIHFYSIRPPLYPLFLWLFHGFQERQFIAVMWMQGLLSFITLLYVRYWLKDRLQLSDWLIFPILLATTLLILFYWKTLTLISSEGISFPLFVLSFLFLADSFIQFSYKHLILLTFFSTLLILTRSQFYYFFALYGMLGIYYFWKKVSPKRLYSFALIVLLGIVLGTFSTRVYHYFLHGKFIDVPPMAGREFLVQALYLTTPDAAKYFKDPKEKLLFLDMMKRLESKHLTKNSALTVIHPPLDFQTSYVFYYQAHPTIEHNYRMSLGDMPVYEKEATAIHMSKILYTHEAKANLAFFLWKIVAFFGHLPIFLCFLALLLAATHHLLLNRNAVSPAASFTFVALMTVFLNTVMIALFQAQMPRYGIYSYFVLFCLAGLVYQGFIKKKFQQT